MRTGIVLGLLCLMGTGCTTEQMNRSGVFVGGVMAGAAQAVDVYAQTRRPYARSVVVPQSTVGVTQPVVTQSVVAQSAVAQPVVAQPEIAQPVGQQASAIAGNPAAAAAATAAPGGYAEDEYVAPVAIAPGSMPVTAPDGTPPAAEGLSTEAEDPYLAPIKISDNMPIAPAVRGEPSNVPCLEPVMK